MKNNLKISPTSMLQQVRKKHLWSHAIASDWLVKWFKCKFSCFSYNTCWKDLCPDLCKANFDFLVPVNLLLFKLNS